MLHIYTSGSKEMIEENSYCICLAFIGVQIDSVVMQKPKKYISKVLLEEFLTILTEGGNLGQLHKLPNTTERRYVVL